MHTRIELSAIGGERIGQLTPLDPTLTFPLNEPSSVTFDISRTHRLATIDYIEPYATDFAYYLHDKCLMEGMIVGVSGEDESNFQIAGKSWLHYLERRIYPFDPADPTANFYAVVAEDVFTIVEHLLDVTLAEPNSLELTYNNGLSGIDRNFRLEPGETQVLLELIGQLAEQKPSFDFAITPGTREFKMYAPHKGSFINKSLVKFKNVAGIRFNDEGIQGNSVLAGGAGTSTKLMKLKSDSQSQAKYRRHDVTVEYGDVTDPNYLNSLADGDIAKSVLKDYGLVVTMAPKHSEEALLDYQTGDTVNLQGDIDYTRFTVDDVFRITEISASMTRNNNYSVELTLSNAEI